MARSSKPSNTVQELLDHPSVKRALEGPEARTSKPRRGRLLFVAIVGAGLAIAFSEGLRNKLLDVLFGAEEEFDYVSTTLPPQPASASAAPADVAPSPVAAPAPNGGPASEAEAPTAAEPQPRAKPAVKAKRTPKSGAAADE